MSLLGISGVVDVGGRVGAGGAHLAMYCEVPSKTRGASFGDRLIEMLEALGLTGADRHRRRSVHRVGRRVVADREPARRGR